MQGSIKATRKNNYNCEIRPALKAAGSRKDLVKCLKQDMSARVELKTSRYVNSGKICQF